ncbi:T7SS effector LXG polymorphic toxin [Sporosarcina sp. ANT_H38]
MLNRLVNEMKAIKTAVEGLVALEDSLKGQGGDAIRAFYAECHLPFLQFFMTFKSHYVNVLTQMDSALDALEPDMNGFIRQTFLEGEVEEGLTEISQLTSSLTDEANEIMNQVADIVALPHLNDSDVQEGVRDARRKRDQTIADLYEFDANQTRALIAIENDLSIMETWLADIESLFNEGLTGVHFESKQWAAITLNSGLQTAIVQQTSAVAGGLGNSDQDNLIGTEIKAGAFQTLESKRTETIERGAYGSYNLLKFHIYENGLIIKEYQLGTRKPIQYEVVKEVEEEFDDGGVRELDNYFEGTKLAFVDYIHPRAIVQKGFKKMALAIIPGVKLSKYKGNLSVKKTSAVENKSKGTDNAVDNPVKVNYSDIRAYRDIDIEKIPIEYRADPRLVSEMNYKGKKTSGTNAAGWERSASKHFNELLDSHPKFFSEANVERIESGLVPVVDDEFIKYCPQYKDFKGDKLIHHHIGGGGQATAVPQSLHKGFGGIHNFEKEHNIRGNDLLTEIGEVFTSEKKP